MYYLANTTLPKQQTCASHAPVAGDTFTDVDRVVPVGKAALQPSQPFDHTRQEERGNLFCSLSKKQLHRHPAPRANSLMARLAWAAGYFRFSVVRFHHGQFISTVGTLTPHPLVLLTALHNRSRRRTARDSQPLRNVQTIVHNPRLNLFAVHVFLKVLVLWGVGKQATSARNQLIGVTRRLEQSEAQDVADRTTGAFSEVR